LLDDPAYRAEVVEHNYAVANRFFGYNVLRRSLRTILMNLTGWAPPSRPTNVPFPRNGKKATKGKAKA